MKRFLSIALCCLFLSFFANNGQAQNKIGYISLQELITAMPEYKQAEKELAEFGNALNELAIDYRSEYNTKDSIFKADSTSWSKAMRDVKRQELRDLGIKVINFQQEANQKMEQKEQELLVPIQQKAVTTTQTVAKENGYAYVLSKESLISFPASDDLLPLVAKKMGIKLETAAPTGK